MLGHHNRTSAKINYQAGLFENMCLPHPKTMSFTNFIL